MSGGALPQLLVNGLVAGSLYAMLALSWGIIYSTTRIFHFAHALAVVAGAYVLVFAVNSANLPLALGMLLAALLAGGLGWSMDRTLYRALRRRKALQLNVFLASLGLLIAGEALVQFLFGPNTRGVAGYAPEGFLFGRVAFSELEMLIVAVSWAVIGIVVGLLRWTRLGLAIRAAESNPGLASTFGLDLHRIFARVFFVGSVMAGVAGGLLALRDAATPTMGVEPVLAGFVAVFIGGIGSVAGAVVGGLVLGMLQNLGGIFLPGHLQGIVAFIALFLVLVWKPSGLFSRAW